MTKKLAIGYCRVSSERQAGNDRVSIEQQKADIQKLTQAHDFKLIDIFEDKKRYCKTEPPLKGQKVEPSGKYDDRPGFLDMLVRLEQGDIDVVIYWDNDRLGRHFRVLGKLANALDIAGQNRPGKPEIELWEANKQASITRTILGIMISIAQDENERRARRVKMGRIGTLQQGRWPGEYRRYGYDTVKEEGKRGGEIVENPTEAKVVKLIYDLADRDYSLKKIRQHLTATGVPQKNRGRKRVYDWSEPVINAILRSSDYQGTATYNFRDGESYSIDIPQIITAEQWQRVQAKLTDRMKTSSRNTIADWAALQHIVECGDCGGKLTVLSRRASYWTDAQGEKHQWKFAIPTHEYRCSKGARQRTLPHSKLSYSGPNLDYQIWRKLVDEVIRHPELIKEQVMARREELQQQGDDVDSDIATNRQKLNEIEAGRNRLMSQLQKGIITESDFEGAMLVANGEKDYLRDEIARLETLRDDAAKVQDDLEFAYSVLEIYQTELPKLDKNSEEMKLLDKEERLSILYRRKRIIQSLCAKVTVWGNGDVLIDGLIDSDKSDKIASITASRN